MIVKKILNQEDLGEIQLAEITNSLILEEHPQEADEGDFDFEDRE